ncbi:MAG TPA: hypothetical protein PLM76_04370 [Tenuifilaceae bacterium]|nr:hypothetical protein [Tenuifilaceae bacterium]
MRKLAVFFFIMGISIASFADRYVARHEDIKTFLETTTYIVLEDNPMSEYNFKIKKAVEGSWTITPYEFITATQFEEMRTDISKSFLVKLQVKFSKDKLEATYNFLSVVLGAAVKRHTDLPDICSIPLSYSSVPEDSYAYKLESLIRFAQNHIKMLDQNPELIKKGNLFDYYNKNTKDAKTKELWLLENDIDKGTRSMSDLRKNYKHPVKIVTKEDIEKAIAEKNDKILFLHKVGPEGTRLQARCYKVIIGAGDDQFYYFDYHMITEKNGDGILAKDLKKLSK